MAGSRREKLESEISTLEDAILYAEHQGMKGLEEAKILLEKVRRHFDQGTWSLAEKELSKASAIKESLWYLEFVEKRASEGGKGGKEGQGPVRFVGDGLCGKYGHHMVKVRISHVRWYYQCRLCSKKGKSSSIR